MSDQMSDADKIRAKRLAKLGAASSQGSTNTSSASTPVARSPEPSSAVPTVERPVPEHKHTQAPSPSSTSTERTSTITIRPSTTPVKRDSDSVPRPRRPTESPQQWEHQTISSIFRVTLDPAQKTDSRGDPLTFLDGVRQDLESEGKPLNFNTTQEVLEQTVQEAASNQGSTKAVFYLLACWKRISRANRTLKAGQPTEAKLDVLREARRYCINYCVLAVMEPTLFGEEEGSENGFVTLLMNESECETGLDFEFLQEIVNKFSEDDASAKDTFVQAVEQMSTRLATLSMNDDYRAYVRALRSLIRFPQMVKAIAESPMFLPPAIPAQLIETNTILGPFFRLSPLQGIVALNYFSASVTRDRGYVLNSQSALRMTLKSLQDDLFETVDCFVKNKDSRQKMLDWFALTVNANHKRRAMRTDPKSVSTDGFMINVTACLDRLSEPFMDAAFSKIDRIQSDYLLQSPRVDIGDETKINADQATSDKFYAQNVSGTPNFISEIFFLTAASHHYGPEAAQSKLSDEKRSLKYLTKDIERFEATRDRFLSNPNALVMFDRRLKEFKDSLEIRQAKVDATEGVLLDETLQTRALSFMRYVIVFMMRLVSGRDVPKQTVELPLPATQPEVFSCLPEYFLEGVVDQLKFVTQHMPHVISPTQCDELVILAITFLRNSEYIKNPGLKSGLVDILFYGTLPTRTSRNGPLGGILNSHPFALSHLLHALMKFFIECEVTGSHTQFYDKFNTRYEIFQVIKCVWGNPHYREQLQTEASQNLDFFVRFVNLLLNDATFLLDEIFSSFQKIASLERELGIGSHAESAVTLEAQVKTEKEEALEENKRKAKSYMSLTTETLAMLKQFTDALADAFTKSEIVQRLADMLDYNLDAMAGPRQAELRVQNMQEYNFNPAGMLADLVEIFLNLAQKPSFHLAIARDGRSYHPENFKATAAILARKGLKSAEELARWMKLASDVAAAKLADDADEEELGEIPDEYLDPLLATLMTDPVILPTSKNIVDRSTIRQMLLSDAHDPFNRAPLAIEDVVDAVELRETIAAFVAEKRGKGKAKAEAEAAAGGGDPMDTTEG